MILYLQYPSTYEHHLMHFFFVFLNEWPAFVFIVFFLPTTSTSFLKKRWEQLVDSDDGTAAFRIRGDAGE